MSVDCVLERAFPNLVEAIELERDATAVGPDEAVKGNGEALLIGPGNGLDAADNPRATWDQDPLTVRGIERDRYVGEDRTGKVAAELCDQDGLQNDPS